MYNQASIYKGGGVYKMGEASALPDNYEKPKRFAVVGDDVYADENGNVHILVASTINPSTIPSGWEFVGAVALRKGTKATILHKNENASVKWASMWLFKVNGLKLDGTDAFVLQQGPTSGNTPVEIGTFTATAAATDLDTLVDELDDWLRENNTAEGALANYNWHAEKHTDADGVDSCFIVVDNYNNQARFEPIKSSTSGASSAIYMWNWTLNENSEAIKRRDGVSSYMNVWNKERFKQNNSNVGSPTDSLTTTGLFKESSFNATTIVKEYYGTYDNYLNYMVPDEEAESGAFYLYKGKGKQITEELSPVIFKNLSGTDTDVFPAASYASSVKGHSTASVEGLNEGDFFLPSIDTLYEILSAMKADGSDVVNASIVKAGGSAYRLDYSRFIPAKYNSTNYRNAIWYARASGSYDSQWGTNGIRCCAVAEIDL